MDRKFFLSLAEKYVQGTATPDERTLVEAWYAELSKDPVTISAIEKEAAKQQIMAELEKAIQMPEEIPVVPMFHTEERPARRRWFTRIAAAAIILILGSAVLLFFNQTTEHPGIASETGRYTGTDVLPGNYKAKLTLANGETIVLDSAGAGELARQGSTKIINKDGQLIYVGDPDGETVYNTVATAKGEMYSMTLSDGSLITLNAGSSVHFPVAFTGKERRIEVTGEVYVKVAKDKNKPFIASVNGMEVLALGTEFNINAYGDDGKILATLVEGSVRVSKQDQQVILEPGQQAITKTAGITKSTLVDLEKTLAWKNNEFIFDKDGLPVIMRQLERWYDVEVVYEGVLPKLTFSGSISRQKNASAVLNMLKRTEMIKMKIEGKKIIVSP